MSVLKIIYILSLILFMQNISYAGYRCVRDLVPDINAPKLSYDCTCPDSRPTPFNLDSNFTRLGKCRDIYKYELDLRKLATSASNRLEVWLDAYRFSDDEYLHKTDSKDIIPVINTPPFNSRWKNLAKDNHYFNLTRSSSYTQLQNTNHISGTPIGLAAASGTPRLCLSDPYLEATFSPPLSSMNSFTIFIVFVKYGIQYDTQYPTHYTHTLLNFVGSSSSMRIYSPDSGSARRYKLSIGGKDYIYTTSAYGIPVQSMYKDFLNPTYYKSEDGVSLISIVSRNKSLEFYLNPDYRAPHNQEEFSPALMGRQNHDITFSESLTSISKIEVLPQNSAPAGVKTLGLCEFAVFTRALSHGERKEVEKYLIKKWEIHKLLSN